MNIPIKALKEISRRYGYTHVVMFAAGPGNIQYIATYGRSLPECDQAAQFGDMMKDALHWPKGLHAIPSRVRILQARIRALETQLAALQETAVESGIHDG